MSELFNQSLVFLNSSKGTFLILGTALSFILKWGHTAWLEYKESREKQFREYHDLVKQLSQSDTPGEYIKLDRQIAVVYELRRYKRYHEVTRRILERWIENQLTNVEHSALKKEMSLTCKYIDSKN